MGAVVGRLAPNVSIAMADAQLKTAAKTLNAIFPPPAFGSRKATWSGGAVGFAEARQHPLIRPLLLILSIAVGGVLLIVCANLAGLLARACSRARGGARCAHRAGSGAWPTRSPAADRESGARVARRDPRSRDRVRRRRGARPSAADAAA